MAIAIKRSDTLRVKVSADMNERLDRLSVLLGLPPSTLAAFAVGHWVAAQERALGSLERIMDSVGARLGDDLSGEVMKQVGLFSKDNQVP